MRARRAVTAAVAGGLVWSIAWPASAQDVRIQIKVDPAVAQEIKQQVKSVIRDAKDSDLAREISQAVQEAIAETTRALPALASLDSLEKLDRLKYAAKDGWQDRNFRAEQTARETRTLQLGANGSLDLKNITGDIIVNAGSGRDTVVEIVRHSRGRTDEDAKQGLDRVKVDVTTRGDRASVEAMYPSENRPPYSVSVSYTVTAPAGTRVSVSSTSGDVAVKGITGDVSVNVVSGGIKVADGNVSSATTISGDVTATNIASTGTFTVSTVSGDTTLDHIKCRRLSAGVVSGAVVARDVTCDNAELKSISGSVEYSGPLAKSGHYDFQTHSGGVKLTVSGSVGFDLQASTFSGQIRLDPPLELQHASVTRRSARGTVGDGAAVVTATAFSGDVVIVKK